MFTRRSILIGTGLATAALSACGSNNPLSSPTPSSGSPSSKVALQQWYHEYGEAGVKEAVEGYAADYPEASVQVRWTPGDYGSILAAQLLTNEVPDVFEVEMGGSLDMIRSGQLADLTDVIGDAVADFNPAVIKRFTFESKLYGIPQTIDMQLLYYRPSILAAAGVAPPTTFAELVTAANAVKTADMGGFFAGADYGVSPLSNLLVWASGHDQLTADRTQFGFLTPEFYAALTSYRDFVDSGAVLPAASAEWYSPDAFAGGETAMAWGGLWSLPAIQAALGDDVGVLPFPAIGDKGRPAVPFGAFGACVAAKGKNVAAAKDFVRWLWLDQEDKQLDFSTAYGVHIPAKPALVGRAEALKSGPGADAARFVTDHGFASDIFWSGAIGEAFNTAVNNVIVGKADPAEEFAQFASTAGAELTR